MNLDGMEGAFCPKQGPVEMSIAAKRRRMPGVGIWQALRKELGR
jgi:hypothetical protein